MMDMNVVLQNRYTLLRIMGQGGMGTVYLAKDERLGGRYVAIKELSVSHILPSEREARFQAFRQEAMMLAQLRHPGIATISDFFFETGSAYLVMEYVPGLTLRQLLRQHPGQQLTLAQALNFTYQLCQVLAYLHQQHPPLIFRDLKPENVIVQPDGQLKLIDFGISRLFKLGQKRDTVPMGTPGYASPEHYGQEQTGPRSDIYSLGIMLHEMLTGHDPTHRTPFTPLAWSSLPPNEHLLTLKAVILKATQLDAGLRYGSILEMQADLSASGTVPTRPSRFPTWTIAGILLLLLLMMGGFMWAARQGGVPAVMATQTALRSEEPPPTTNPIQTSATFLAATSLASTGTSIPTRVPYIKATVPAEIVRVLVVSGTKLHTDTGLIVQPGQRISIEYVSGSWRAGPLTTWPLVGPEGDPQVASKSIFPVAASPIMALVVGVGQERPLPVGLHVEFTSTTGGVLWLGPNDDNVTDNVGSLTVKISVSG